MKKLLFLLIMLTTVNYTWAKAINEPPVASINSDPHNSGRWAVLIDKNGSEVWYELMQMDENSYQTMVRIDYSKYGGYRPGIDPVRKVPFYFMINGTRYGATKPYQPYSLGDIFENRIIMGGGFFTVDVGYTYTIGIYGDGYAIGIQFLCVTGNPEDYCDTILEYEITDDAVIFSAKGDGTITLTIEFIDDETDETTSETCVGESEVSYSVARENKATYVNYRATIEIDGQEDPVASEARFYFEIPAKNGVAPAPRGDVDGDGAVSIADIVAIINFLLSHDATGIDLDAADVDFDGGISIADVVAIINYVLANT